MKQRAFTLIELLAIIVILGVLITIVAPSVYNIIKQSKENSYNVLVDVIEDSAALYVYRHRSDIEETIDINGYYEFTLEQLANEGLLKTPVVDPRTDTEIALTKKIYVTRDVNLALEVCYEDTGCEI